LIRRATLHCTHTHTQSKPNWIWPLEPPIRRRSGQQPTNKKRAGLASSQSIQALYWAIHTHMKRNLWNRQQRPTCFSYIHTEKTGTLSYVSLYKCWPCTLSLFPSSLLFFGPSVFVYSLQSTLVNNTSTIGRYT
jgi:hypothetical protein